MPAATVVPATGARQEARAEYANPKRKVIVAQSQKSLNNLLNTASNVKLLPKRESAAAGLQDQMAIAGSMEGKLF